MNPGSVNDVDSAYVEFRRVFDDVAILARPWSPCVHPPQGRPGAPVADGVSHRRTNQRGEVVDDFGFKKMITSLSTNGSGLIITPQQTRLTDNHKKSLAEHASSAPKS